MMLHQFPDTLDLFLDEDGNRWMDLQEVWT